MLKISRRFKKHFHCSLLYQISHADSDKAKVKQMLENSGSNCELLEIVSSDQCNRLLGEFGKDKFDSTVATSIHKRPLDFLNHHMTQRCQSSRYSEAYSFINNAKNVHS